MILLTLKSPFLKEFDAAVDELERDFSDLDPEVKTPRGQETRLTDIHDKLEKTLNKKLIEIDLYKRLLGHLLDDTLESNHQAQLRAMGNRKD